MKKTKIIIPVVLVIIIAAIVIGIVMFGNKVAISGKSKVSMGLSKTMKTFEVSEELKDEMGKYKYLNSINSKPFESEVKMSVDANIDNLEDLVGDGELAETIKTVIKEISNTDITTKYSFDKKEEIAKINLKLNAKDILGEISGDAVITPDKIAFRSEDLNEDYLIIKKDDSEEFFDLIKQMFEMDYSGMNFSDEEIAHFKQTYGSVFSDFITDDMLKSEKSNFEFDGKSKSCNKETLTLDNDKVKDLLKKYIETYESDKKGKDIIEAKMSSLYGDLYEDELKPQLEDAIDEIKDAIDEIEDVKVEFITYCSLLDVYGTETIITIDDEALKIIEEFNGNETNIKVVLEDEEYANLTVKNSGKELSIVGKVGVEDVFVELDLVISNKQIAIKADVKEGKKSLGKGEIILDLNTKKDTEKEFEQDVNLKVAVDVPDTIKGEFKLDLSENLKFVDSVKLPKLSNAISITDEDKLVKYFETCQKSLEKYLKKLEKSEIYNLIYSGIELSSNNSTSKFDDLLDEEDEDLDIEEEELSESTEKIDSKDIQNDIKYWFLSLEPEEGMTISETIEEKMITEDVFLDDVSIKVAVSWENGEATNKGFVNINVFDEENNMYMFFLDISNGTIYSESDVPSEVEEIEWKQY